MIRLNSGHVAMEEVKFCMGNLAKSKGRHIMLRGGHHYGFCRGVAVEQECESGARSKAVHLKAEE